MKIVFDTNVYVQSTKRGGFADQLLGSIAERHDLELYVSLDILLELREVLQSKFHLPREHVTAVLNRVRQVTVLVEPSVSIEGVLKDTDDHKILECALEARADCIVTSDRELLKLKTFRAISIVHPSVMKFASRN